MSRNLASLARISALLLGLTALVACSPPAVPQIEAAVPGRIAKWSKSTLEAAARIPIQEGGRVKPLDTFARFQLLEISGKRSLKVAINGEEQDMSALEWLLDTLFFPRQAADYPVFLVEDYDVLSDVGMKIDGLKKRDRYSYAFLAKNEKEIFKKASEYRQLDQMSGGKDLGPIQKQVIRLAQTISQFEQLSYAFLPARTGVDLEKTYATLAPEFPGRKVVPLVEFVDRLPKLAMRHESLVATGGDKPASDELLQLSGVLSDLQAYAKAQIDLRLFPSPAGDEDWFSPSDLVMRGFLSTEGLEPQFAAMKTLYDCVPSNLRGVEMAAIEKGIADFGAATRQLADARGQAGKIDMEVSYYKAQYFTIAQWTFVFALMIGCLLWLAPRSKLLYGATWLLTSLPWAVLVVGIAVRCVLRHRPPVTNLYETTLFISAIVVFAALIMEFITRQRIALFVATIAGSAGLYLSSWYEEIGRQDTMPQLQAVLDTNFWLSTHVTCVTIGYAAAFLAAAIAHVFILGKATGLNKGQPEFYRTLTRLTYGAIGFSVVFSTVGTILGGVWANDSWGRFWGWDPKENGALMIVLMNLILLHARLGGYIREFGLALGAILLSIVVTFSWFHTNQLGIGLHAYGFDENIRDLVWSTYMSEALVFGIGCLAWFKDRNAKSSVVASTALPIRPAKAR